MRYPIVAFTLGLAAGLAGCASTPDTGAPRPRSDLITAEEIEGTGALTAYEAVERLRRQWLVSRGAHSLEKPEPSLPVVYLGGTRLGELDELRNIRASEVEQLRYLDARAATTRYGSDHDGGVILVTVRRR